MKIVYDAGHGNFDSGAVNNVTCKKEKDINLIMCKLLAQISVKRGHEVKLTRIDDTYIPFTRSHAKHKKITPVAMNRTEISNRFKPDVFVSIHCNSSEKKYPHGALVLYYGYIDHEEHKTVESDVGKPIARTVLDQLVKQCPFLESRWNKVQWRDDLTVLRVKAPAILVELAFISNEKDSMFLSNPYEQPRMANAILDGLEEWHAARL